MSMRHHWQELDELLAQLDQEERFRQGPFRPGMKPLCDAAAVPRAAGEIAATDESGKVIPLRPVKPSRAP